MQNFKSYQEYLDNWCILITRFGFSQLCLVAVDATGTLQQDFGVVGTALNWFDSFLSGRKQRILVGDKTSDDFNLNCGVPRAVVWGLFYLLSTSPASLTLFLSTSLPSMVMLTTPSFTSPSDLVLYIRKLTLSLWLKSASLMFAVSLLEIV